MKTPRFIKSTWKQVNNSLTVRKETIFMGFNKVQRRWRFVMRPDEKVENPGFSALGTSIHMRFDEISQK